MSPPAPQFFLNLACADMPASVKFYEALGFRVSKYMVDSNATGMHWGPWITPEEKFPSTMLNVMLLKKNFFKSFLPAENDGTDPKDREGGWEMAKVGNGTHKLTTDLHNHTSALFCLKVDNREEADALVEMAVKNGGKADPSNIYAVPGMYGRNFEDLDGYIWELIVWDKSDAWSLPEEQCPAKVES